MLCEQNHFLRQKIDKILAAKCMFCPIFIVYSVSLYKTGQDFLDIQLYYDQTDWKNADTEPTICEEKENENKIGSYQEHDIIRRTKIKDVVISQQIHKTKSQKLSKLFTAGEKKTSWTPAGNGKYREREG